MRFCRIIFKFFISYHRILYRRERTPPIQWDHRCNSSIIFHSLGNLSKKKIFIPKLNKNSPRFLLFFPSPHTQCSPPDIITRPQVTRMTFEEFAKSVNEAVKNSKPTILIYPPCFITFRPFFRRDEEIARKMPSKFFPNYEILGIIPGHIAHRIPRLFPPCCPRCIVKHGSMPADKRKFGIQSSFDGLGARRPIL